LINNQHINRWFVANTPMSNLLANYLRWFNNVQIDVNFLLAIFDWFSERLPIIDEFVHPFTPNWSEIINIFSIVTTYVLNFFAWAETS